MGKRRPGPKRGSRLRKATTAAVPAPDPRSLGQRLLSRLGWLALALVGALVVVLGGLRLYGWYRLQGSERALAGVLGDGEGSQGAPIGGEGTAAPWIRTALTRLQTTQKDVEDLNELAMLGAGAMTSDQASRSTRLVMEHAGVLAALRGTVGWPAARIGFWQTTEPEREGELQAGLLALAQIASVEGRLACEQGDADRFEQAMGILQRVAAGLEMEDQAQPVLVGLMVENIQHLLLTRGIASTVADRTAAGAPESLLSVVDLRQAFFRTLRAQVQRLRTLRSPGDPTIQNLPEWLGDRVYFDLFLARSLDRIRMEAHEVDRPLLVPLAAVADMPALAPMAIAATLGPAGRVQIVQAGRAFARAALALRRQALDRGSYPRSLAEVPDVASVLGDLRAQAELELHPDGGARLRLPGGDERLREMTGDPTMPFLLNWELPPPPPTQASGSRLKASSPPPTQAQSGSLLGRVGER